jgi:transcriptional regulator with XRE-family HTH domain
MFLNNIDTPMDNDALESAVDQHVGQRLKHRRIVLGLTRQEVGEAVKVSVQQIHKYETAINRVSSSKLYNLAKFLKVPVNYFFEMLESTGLSSSSTLAEDADLYEAKELSEREVVKLMQVYKKIKPQSLRKKILDLIDALVESDEAKDDTKEG